MSARHLPPALTLAAALLLPLAAGAQEAQQTRAWAASCAACHGSQGRSLGGIPSINGVDKAQLLQKLLAYKRGELPATVMHQHAKGYSDAELERLADFFSRQAR
jgi:cytochrome c553